MSKGKAVSKAEQEFKVPDPLAIAETDSSTERDWFLQSIVVLCDLGMEVDLTLSSAGTLISGRLISGRKYFLELADLMRTADVEADGQNALNAVTETWSKLSKMYDEDYDPAEIKAPGFIHLRRAKIFSPAGKSIPSNEEGMLWRGMISKIDGFSVGGFEPD